MYTGPCYQNPEKAFEVTFVKNRKGDGVVARCQDRWAFPSFNWAKTHQPPEEDEVWLVNIEGQNKGGSVYFLRPVKRLMSREDVQRVNQWKQDLERFLAETHYWMILDRTEIPLLGDYEALAKQRLQELAKQYEDFWGDDCFERECQVRQISPLFLAQTWQIYRNKPRTLALAKFLAQNGYPKDLNTLGVANHYADLYPEKSFEEIYSFLQNQKEQADQKKREAKEKTSKIQALLAEYPDQERQVVRIQTEKYLIRFSGDEDFGKHRADEGYDVLVVPCLPEDFVPVQAWDETYYKYIVREAENLIGERITRWVVDEAEAEHESGFYGQNSAIVELLKRIEQRQIITVVVEMSPNLVLDIQQKLSKRFPDANQIRVVEQEKFYCVRRE